MGDSVPQDSAGDMLSDVDNFDPDQESCPSSSVWLARIEQFAGSHNLSEDQKYCYARGKLVGAAKSWLIGSNVSCWEDFCRQLKGQPFGTTGSNFNITRLLARRRMQRSESREHYFQEMVKLGTKHGISDNIVVKHIVAGIGDPVLTKVVTRNMGLQQLLKTLKWQSEVEHLLQSYSQNKECIDIFDRLAQEMENFVLDDSALGSVVYGNEDVLATAREQVERVLQKCRSSVSYSDLDVGTSKTHEIVIHLKEGCSMQDAERTHNKHFDHIHSTLLLLLTNKTIQKSTESYNCALFHENDLFLNLLDLNAVVHKEQPCFLVPQPLLQSLATFKYFTCLDFNGGHLQIPLQQSSLKYFSFDTLYGKFELRKAPKNFINTTIIFNKILIDVAGKLPPGTVIVLHDTLIIPSMDTTDGLQKLELVLTALAVFGLTVNLKGTQFFLSELRLFNWTVRHGQVSSHGPAYMPNSRTRLELILRSAKHGSLECLLHQLNNNGTMELLGNYQYSSKGQHEANARDTDTTQALVESMEHFRQFLLFHKFKVLLSFPGCVTPKLLLPVQNYDFTFETSSERVDKAQDNSD